MNVSGEQCVDREGSISKAVERLRETERGNVHVKGTCDGEKTSML